MKKTLLTIAISALCAHGVFAQLPAGAEYEPPKLVLDLATALDIALSENTMIRVADLEIERKHYARQEIAANLYPSVSVSGQYSYAIKEQRMSKEENGFSMSADNTIAATAQLNVPLFVPSLYPTLKLSRMDILAAVESARSSRISLVNEVRKAYYNLLLAQQSMEVLLASRDNIEDTVENTRLLYENELTSEYNLLTAEVQLGNLQPSIIQAQSGIEVAGLYLKMLLELPQDVEIELAGKLEDFSTEILNASIDYSTDVSANTNIRLFDIQTDMVRQQIKTINMGRLPTVAAFFTLTAYGSDVNVDFEAIMQGLSPKKELWFQFPMSAGLNVSIPVFNGFSRNKQVKQARNTVTQMELQREYVERQVQVQAQTNISNLLTARESMLANERTMEQANRAYSITLARYNNGLGTILELNSAELALTQARLAYSQSIYNYLAAYADYLMSIGEDYPARGLSA